MKFRQVFILTIFFFVHVLAVKVCIAYSILHLRIFSPPARTENQSSNQQLSIRVSNTAGCLFGLTKQSANLPIHWSRTVSSISRFIFLVYSPPFSYVAPRTIFCNRFPHTWASGLWIHVLYPHVYRFSGLVGFWESERRRASPLSPTSNHSLLTSKEQ